MDQIGSGYYPDNHSMFPGLEWWGIIDWGTFKNNCLDLDTDHTFEDNEYVACFPVISNGISGDVANDAGGAIGRWVGKVKEAEYLNRNKSKQKSKFYRRVLAEIFLWIRTWENTRLVFICIKHCT